MTDQLVINRPEGISDGRWAALSALAHHTATGHMPWCDDHQDGDVDDLDSWCRHSITYGTTEVVLASGGRNGQVELHLYTEDTDPMTFEQAEALYRALHDGLRLAKGSAAVSSP